MADKTSNPISETKAEKPNAIAVWFEADTDEKKAAALKAYPELANIFSLASTIKTNK